METMKQNRIIAVDTSLGTNFLISACDDATVSELRGLIQKWHYSCFPDYGSINVLALLVEYSQQQYHVTDSLLIGQIFRKTWNKIHAVVSSVSLRAGSTLRSSKSAEAESLAGKKAGNQFPDLDDTLLAGTKSLGVDKPSNKDLTDIHYCSSPLLCGEKGLKDANDMFPLTSNSQASWKNRERFGCPLLSIEEAPYTQSHSQLDLATRAGGSKEVLDKGQKRRKRKSAKEEILGRKPNQAEGMGQANYYLDSDEDLSSGRKSPISIKRDINTKEHNGEQCMQDTVCRHEFSESLALLKRDAQFAEAYKKPEKSKSQVDDILSTKTCSKNDSIPKKCRTSSPHSQVFVENSRKLKTSSEVCMSLYNDTVEGKRCHTSLIASFREAGFTTMEEEIANKALGKIRGEGGLPSPKMSAEKEGKGTEEVILNSGDRDGKLDLSMGYPIQLNDHSILLVASVSAEVVPETQESEMQSQDGKCAVGEEVCLPERGLDVSGHKVMESHCKFPTQDPLATQENMAQELASRQDLRNMTSIDVNNVTEHLAFLAEKREISNPKPCVLVNLPSKGFNIEKDNTDNETEILGAYNDERHVQEHESAHAGGNHENILIEKKKKSRKKKVFEMHKVSVQEDSRFVALCPKGHDNQGVVDPKKDAKEIAVLVANPTETCNHVKGGKNCHMLQEHGRTQLGNFNADPKEMQRQNRTLLNVDEQNCKESSFAGHETVAMGTILIDQPEAVKLYKGNRIQVCSMGGGEIMQGKTLQEDAVTQLGATRRKKKKRRKEHPLPSPEGALGEKSPIMGNENKCAPFSIKELPNVLKLDSTKEGELCRRKKTKFADEQVTKKNSKKEMIETDPNVGLMQEQGQVNTTKELANMNEKEPLLKDGLVESLSARSAPKEFSQEGLVKTKPSYDVFDFESSETVNRPKDASNPEAHNLEKLCSVAEKLVEEDILNSTMAIRKSSRKSVHPKRWITVLSERHRTSKNNLKKQHAGKSKPIADGEHHPEPLFAEEESSQTIVNDLRAACPAGCGRVYSKKTSAYYRHSKICSGGDH